jgi:hypothetical protein
MIAGMTGSAYSQDGRAPTLAETYSTAFETLGRLEQLLSPYNDDKAVFIAKVTRVVKQPETVYEQFRRSNPALDPELCISIRGGRLDVLEQLCGQEAPAYIEVDNSDIVDPRTPYAGATVPGHRILGKSRPRIRWMQPGQLWLIVCDARRQPDWRITAAMHLAGQNDIILRLYKRHLLWRDMEDRQAAFAQMRSVLTSRTEPLESRVAAYYGLVTGLRPGPNSTWDGPDYPRLQQALVELISQKDLPKPLLVRAVLGMHVAPGKEIASGSDGAVIGRYLLDILARETDPEVFSAALERLGNIARQSDSKRSGATIYHFPDIMSALERVHTLDTASGSDSRVSGTLSNLKDQMSKDLADKSATVVICRLP